MQEKLLRVEHITKAFPGVLALNDMSFELNHGEVLGLCGENGAGKSTLMKILSGVYQADSGEYYLEGDQCNFKTPYESIRAGIGIIHQELSYLKDLTVAENIYQSNIPVRGGIVQWRKMYADAEALLLKFDIHINPKELMCNLPIAQKQLVEIAKAISRQAKIVVMDEPTSSLGIEDVKKLKAIIHMVIENGTSVIFISHRLEELFDICDRIMVMRDGMKVAEYEKKDFEQYEIISKMVGRKVSQLYEKEDIPIGEEVLRMENVTTESLHDISLSVHRGEFVGLYGMAGNGQDEVLNTIFGLNKHYMGKIVIKDQKYKLNSPIHAIQNGIAYVTAERKRDGLILCHSVKQNMVLCNYDKVAGNGFVSQKAEKEISNKWIKEFSIKTPTMDTCINSLSGGNQQKVILGKWLEREPSVLLLNEPTRGVDVGAKDEIFRILQERCKEGACALFVTSDMLELLSMADTIYVMYEGRITKRFTREEATQNKIMLAAIDKE